MYAVGQEVRAWVIDPIDGTNNFAAQQEDFAVMMALLWRNGSRSVWFICDAVKGDCYHGGGAFPPCRNNEPFRAFKKKPLGDF